MTYTRGYILQSSIAFALIKVKLQFGRRFVPVRLTEEQRFEIAAQVVRHLKQYGDPLEAWGAISRAQTSALRRLAMSVTYYVALPFIDSDEGPVPAEAQECPSEGSAILKAEAMSRKEGIVGALAFKRTGEPNQGQFGDPTILRTFGLVPENLDEL